MPRSMVSWPSQNQIIEQPRSNSTIESLRSIFHNSGIVMSLAFLVLEYGLKPQIQELYTQRCQLSSHFLLKVRKLIVKLQDQISSSSKSAISFNADGQSIERGVQTSESANDEYDINQSAKGSNWEVLNEKLQDINLELEVFNNHCIRPSQSLDDLELQVKLTTDQFKNSIDENEYKKQQLNLHQATQNIREIKGYVISGKFP